MATAPSDISDYLKWSKVVGGHYPGHLSVCLGGHRRIKHFGSLGILREIAPVSLREYLGRRWVARLGGVPKLQKGRPVHWKSEHERNCLHGLRVSRAQQP